MAAFSSSVLSSTALGLPSSDIHRTVLTDIGRAQHRLVEGQKAETTTLRAERYMRVAAISRTRLCRECMDETDRYWFNISLSHYDNRRKLPTIKFFKMGSAVEEDEEEGAHHQKQSRRLRADKRHTNDTDRRMNEDDAASGPSSIK